MNWYYCISILIEFNTLALIHIHGFDLKCPDSTQWKVRADLRCATQSTSYLYTCLWNNITSKDKEYCGFEEVSKFGNKYMFMPNPQQVPCSKSAYQPFKFTTIGNSKCVFLKSTCYEEGQVTADDSSTTSDASCRCDYTRGYVFFTAPRNRCTCIPSQEDCTCIFKPCIGENENLKRDYKCYREDNEVLPERIPCEDIVSNAKPDTIYRTYISQNITKPLIIRRVSSTAIQVLIFILLALITILAVLLVGIFPVVGCITVSTDLNIKGQENSNIHKVLHGDNVELHCKVRSYFGINSVKWHRIQQGKTYEINLSNTHNKYAVSGTKTISLKIHNLASEDLGTYFCQVENKFRLSRESILRILTVLSRFHRLNSVKGFLKHLLGFAAEDDKFITMESFTCIKKVMKPQIHGTDVKLEVLVDDLSGDVTKVIWLKQSETLCIIDPDKTPDKYGGGSCDEPSLIVKDCSLSDSEDYICIMLDSEELVVCDSYLLYPLDVMPKPSRDFPEQWIQKGDLHDVVKYVKDEMLVSVKEEKMQSQRETRYRILFQRLANESMENIKDVQSLFQEIYNFWLKEFDSNASKNGKREEPYFPAWNLILFLENLISCENTRWIFEKEMMSFVILCGLILSAKNSLQTRQNNLFILFLKQFQHKLQSKEGKDFFKDMSTDLDPYGNTFFHYIVLFGSPEAIIILNKNNELLTKDASFCKSNRRNLTPLQLSGFLGKAIVFRSLFIKTKNLNKKIDRLKHFVKKGLEELDGRIEPADDSKSTSQKSLVTEKGNSSSSKNRQVSVIANHFETEVLKCVVYGTKAEYLELLELLSKSKIKEDIVAQELKKEFIKSDILRKYLIMSE